MEKRDESQTSCGLFQTGKPNGNCPGHGWYLCKHCINYDPDSKPWYGKSLNEDKADVRKEKI